MITNNQIKLVYALCRDIEIDNDTLHKNIYKCYGKKSIKDLSPKEVQEVIKVLKKLEVDHKKKAKKPVPFSNKVIELATQNQLEYIKCLEESLGWSDRQLEGFRRRIIRKTKIRTKREANKVINGLKAVSNHQTQGGKRNGEHCQ
ncbi:MAG: DUF1018 domain-containing protein [Deltaproteobacteria bacterium]|nr:DUF1018 domain-containing protein [Deltaproteobacteria bacterium]